MAQAFTEQMPYRYGNRSRTSYCTMAGLRLVEFRRGTRFVGTVQEKALHINGGLAHREVNVNILLQANLALENLHYEGCRSSNQLLARRLHPI